jgi:hypothetical protein
MSSDGRSEATQRSEALDASPYGGSIGARPGSAMRYFRCRTVWLQLLDARPFPGIHRRCSRAGRLNLCRAEDRATSRSIWSRTIAGQSRAGSGADLIVRSRLRARR